MLQIFTVKNNIDALSSAVLSRIIYLPFPVVADLIILTVSEGANSIVMKLDVIGMDPDKKYSMDPMLTPMLFKECKLINF